MWLCCYILNSCHCDTCQLVITFYMNKRWSVRDFSGNLTKYDWYLNAFSKFPLNNDKTYHIEGNRCLGKWLFRPTAGSLYVSLPSLLTVQRKDVLFFLAFNYKNEQKRKHYKITLDYTKYAYFSFFNPVSMEVTVWANHQSKWTDCIAGETTTIWCPSIMLTYHQIL